MTRVVELDEVIRLHGWLIETSGGATGLRDLGRLQAALSQPFASFDGDDLYPDVVAKAVALGFSLIQGHPFIDGNKRIGHLAMEATLDLNGFALSAAVDDAERVILGVASGEVSHSDFEAWVRRHTSLVSA
jgi:death-on-curing protein